MSKQVFVDFRAVKQAVSMLQILDHYGLTGAMTRSSNGQSLSGKCPLHNGDNPTQFRVSLPKNVWNCFGQCRGGGNVLDFVARKEDCTIREAALRISEWFKLPSPSEAGRTRTSPPKVVKPESAEAKPAPSPADSPEESAGNQPLGFELKNLNLAHPYCTERGLSPETVSAFRLGFCEKGTMAERLVIPIHNPAGQLVAYAGRWPGEPPEGTSKYKFPTGFGKSLELFNLHRAMEEPDTQPLVIVEGFFDAIKLWQNGIRRVVAIMGCSLSPAQEALLVQHTGSQTKVLVMLDEDDAGKAGREQVVQRLALHRYVKFFQFEREGMQPEQLTATDLAELMPKKGGSHAKARKRNQVPVGADRDNGQCPGATSSS